MAAKEYQRTTREILFNDLEPEIIQKIRKYLEKNDINDFESNILLAVETTSEKIKGGFLSELFGGGNYVQRTIIILTPQRLLWCSVDLKNEVTVLSANLTEIEVKDFSSDLIEDSGLDVFGFINHSAERVTAFLGLGEEQISQKFKQFLSETIARARLK